MEGHIADHVYRSVSRKAVSSVSGIGGLGGAVGGMLAAEGVGILLDAYKSDNNIQGGYNLIFVLCGLAYIIAISLFHILSPQLKKVRFDNKK
jgi:ACS family hexuronate transporter-like MFS transporter